MKLTLEEVKNMLEENNFFDESKHKEGTGVHNNYIPIENDGEILLKDTATGLTWQQSGSLKIMSFSGAQNYIKALNRKKFAGHNDWRLPTLEEAMSLMEPERSMKGDLHIDSAFDSTQSFIWTSDIYSRYPEYWAVLFGTGTCTRDRTNSGLFFRWGSISEFYVRAVCLQ